MAHLWIKDETDAWVVSPLTPSLVALSGAVLAPVQAARGSALASAPAWLGCVARPGTPETWVIGASASGRVAVNGHPLFLRLAVLRDRDEILLDHVQRLYFSTERLAQVVPFPGADRAMHCARCRQAILVASPAVQCPQCQTWCHASEELPCWTYTAQCPLCPQESALDADYRWTPEQLAECA